MSNNEMILAALGFSNWDSQMSSKLTSVMIGQVKTWTKR